MSNIKHDAAIFVAANEKMSAQTMQRTALRLACGIDLDQLAAAPGAARRILLQRIERALRQERAKSVQRHWSYDLNRHIALKQAFDRVTADSLSQKEGAP